MTRTIGSSELAQMLSDSSTPGARECARLLHEMTGDIALGRSRAASLARTLATKYGLAVENGHVVDGLDRLEKSLRSLGSEARVLGAYLDGASDSYFTVVLAESLDRIVGIVHVVPAARSGSPD